MRAHPGCIHARVRVRVRAAAALVRELEDPAAAIPDHHTPAKLLNNAAVLYYRCAWRRDADWSAVCVASEPVHHPLPQPVKPPGAAPDLVHHQT